MVVPGLVGPIDWKTPGCPTGTLGEIFLLTKFKMAAITNLRNLFSTISKLLEDIETPFQWQMLCVESLLMQWDVLDEYLMYSYHIFSPFPKMATDAFHIHFILIIWASRWHTNSIIVANFMLIGSRNAIKYTWWILEVNSSYFVPI